MLLALRHKKAPLGGFRRRRQISYYEESDTSERTQSQCFCYRLQPTDRTVLRSILA